MLGRWCWVHVGVTSGRGLVDSVDVGLMLRRCWVDVGMLPLTEWLHICTAYLYPISLLQIFMAYHCSKSVLHVYIGYLYCWSILHIYCIPALHICTSCLHCESVLHICFFAYLCCISTLRICIASLLHICVAYLGRWGPQNPYSWCFPCIFRGIDCISETQKTTNKTCPNYIYIYIYGCIPIRPPCLFAFY